MLILRHCCLQTLPLNINMISRNQSSKISTLRRIKQNIYATFQTFRYTLCSNLYFSKYLNYFQGLCRYAFYHSIFVLYLKAIFGNSDCCPLFTYISIAHFSHPFPILNLYLSPFSGFLFFNFLSLLLLSISSYHFRPLPGDLISQYAWCVYRNGNVYKFPSPSRGSYFSIVSYGRLGLVPIQFPSPSRGSYFSMSNKGDVIAFMLIVSVPFPGILFLNTTMNIRYVCFKQSFRPLPGDLISQ